MTMKTSEFTFKEALVKKTMSILERAQKITNQKQILKSHWGKEMRKLWANLSLVSADYHPWENPRHSQLRKRLQWIPIAVIIANHAIERNLSKWTSCGKFSSKTREKCLPESWDSSSLSNWTCEKIKSTSGSGRSSTSNKTLQRLNPFLNILASLQMNRGLRCLWASNWRAIGIKWRLKVRMEQERGSQMMRLCSQSSYLHSQQRRRKITRCWPGESILTSN